MNHANWRSTKKTIYTIIAINYYQTTDAIFKTSIQESEPVIGSNRIQ